MPAKETRVDPEVMTLLKQVQQESETVQDLALSCLTHFRTECRLALAWQQTEGRERVRSGDDPEVIREETQQRVEQARARLKDRLKGLLLAAEQHQL